MKKVRITIAVLVVALLAAPAFAVGKLRGSVVDSSGAPIKDVKVTMQPADPAMRSFETTSNKKGKFVFGLLKPGTYRLVAMMDGMRVKRIDANVAIPDDDSLWAAHDDMIQGAEMPQFAVTGLSEVTYDLILEPYDGDLGEYGTGLPVSPVKRIVEMIEGGEIDRAEEELRRSLIDDPESPTAHYLLAFTLVSGERAEEALEEAEATIAADPTFEGAQLLRGRILKALGRSDEAIAAFEAELDIAQSDEVRRDSWLEKSIALEAGGRNEEAAQALEKVIEIDPAMGEAYRKLADLYMASGEREKASAMMAKVLEFGESDPNILFNMAAEKFNSNEFEEAASYLDKVVAAAPDFADAYRLLGFTRLNLGDTDAAAKSLRRYVEIAPEGDPNVATANALLSRIDP